MSWLQISLDFQISTLLGYFTVLRCTVNYFSPALESKKKQENQVQRRVYISELWTVGFGGEGMSAELIDLPIFIRRE